MSAIHVRPAQREDAPQILHFIHELAAFEDARDRVAATLEDIEQRIFGKEALVHSLICEQDSRPIGCAVYFFTFSTWTGKHSLFLEDLFVSQSARGLGGGKALLRALARVALARDCARFEWNVLDWNTAAIEFYQSLGAKPQSQWIGYRLSGTALTDLAASAPDASPKQNPDI